jgi:hypothetical protein
MKSQNNTTPAPQGYHYMPNGKLMKNTEMTDISSNGTSYKPLFIIIGLILLTSIVSLVPSFNDLAFIDLITVGMGRFMAGFFLVFSGFKLIDVAGFAEGYSTYDILAKKVPVYGKVYPFLELALGLGYILAPTNLYLNVFTALLLGFSSIGVIQSLQQNKPIKCACLGTALNIPLSTITVVEDIGMAVMALVMIIL